MQRREVLALLGGALGLAASGPALAAPVTGLDVFDEHDVPGRMARVRTQLDAIRARPVSPEMQEYLATTGLPADIIGRTMGALAATAAFRELDQHAQAHPEAQALLDDEAPHAGAVAGAWSGFLHHQHNVRGVTEALRERPELGLDLREKLQQAAAQLGMPERWVEVLLYDHPAIHRRVAMARAFKPRR